MKKIHSMFLAICLVCLLLLAANQQMLACSTTLLKSKNSVIIAHNLDEGHDVPGAIYINKRGTLKAGRTWSEIFYKDGRNASNVRWISRYGSVTFNPFGKEVCHAGINEAGLCMYEMTLTETNYPQGDNLHKMLDWQWIQYILDNYSCVDQVIQSANEFELDGTGGHHFFVADHQGNCAVIEFLDRKVVIRKNEELTLKALFNQPYEKELEVLNLFKGFGGSYDFDYANPKIPRVVKAAQLVKEFDDSKPAVEYGFELLKKINGPRNAKWSIVYDPGNKKVHFRTEESQEIKCFSMAELDFSNTTPVQTLDIHTKESGNVLDRFQPLSNEANNALIKHFEGLFSDDDFNDAGQTRRDCFAKMESCFLSSGITGYFLSGKWKADKVSFPETNISNDDWILTLNIDRDVVSGEISDSLTLLTNNKIDHLQAINNQLSFSFRSDKNTIFLIKGVFGENTIKARVFGMEKTFGDIILKKED